MEQPQVEEHRWRQPLKKKHLEKEENELEKVRSYCMMLERLWEHPILSAGREGHQIGTLATLL